jgi:Asp-tRNA(Asn)/Glu-tRNA(Gln) amidotransferase A subunit family amidase
VRIARSCSTRSRPERISREVEGNRRSSHRPADDFCDLELDSSARSDVREIAMPGAFDYDVLVDIMLFEFHRVLGEQFRACRNPDEVFGPVVCANLRRGSESARGLSRALAARERQSAAIHALFDEIDALVTPVLPGPTPRLDAPAEEFDRQRQYMIPFSGAGVPAISLPCGVHRRPAGRNADRRGPRPGEASSAHRPGL